jgi:hypothetical protein
MKASPAAAAMRTMGRGLNKKALRVIKVETDDYENATATTATALQKVAKKGRPGKGFQASFGDFSHRIRLTGAARSRQTSGCNPLRI